VLEVKRLRQGREWNQTELAFHAGLAPSVISEIENGKRDPSARTLRKLAEALQVDVADLFPKGQAPLPDFEDERRLHYLKPWARYINTLANNVEGEIEKGHITDLNWWQEFNRDVITLTHLCSSLLPPPEQQTEGERVELLRLSEAIDRLNEVADKMGRAMEPVIAEMHKEMYAKERERRKAALKVIHGRLSA
jgi:transcriptional regulator with XRE-family HTH domain